MWKNLRNELDAAARVGLTFLALALAADVGFMVLHLIHFYTPFLAYPEFSLSKDRGYAEVFQYVQEYWTVLLLLAMAVRSRRIVYGAWAVPVGYLLFDDAFQLHEKGGEIAVRRFGFHPALGLRAQDFGEMSVFATVGPILLVVVVLAYVVSGREGRCVARRLALLLGLAVFFGTVVDIVGMALAPRHPLAEMIEDGGEMVAVSLLTWHVLDLWRAGPFATVLDRVLLALRPAVARGPVAPESARAHSPSSG